MLKTLMQNNKTVLVLLNFFLVLCGVQGQTYGDYPYGEHFDSGIKPADVSIPVSGNSNYPNRATFTTQGVRLTEAKTNQFGAFFVNNRQFSSINGMHIEFEYSMYGGTDGGADGFTFFLFDASVESPTIGATGAGLGYSYNRATSSYSSLRNKGLSGAYLGISLDSYGNHKKRRYQDNSLVNGINWNNYTGYINERNHVTLRGAKGYSINSSTSGTSSTIGLSDGYTGYPVLITQPTGGTSASLRRGIIKNDDGTFSTISNYTGNFDLRSGAYTIDPTNANYRKAIIDLYPHENGGYLVTVKIQHGTTVTTVIENYHYKTSIDYYENAILSYGDYLGNVGLGTSSTSYKYTLDTTVPKFLRFGFAASTGAYTDNHYIRMIEVTLPSSAKANHDSGSTYSGVATNIDALKNDLGYSGRVSQNQVGSSAHLDKTTFKFIDNNGVATSNPYEYTEIGIGTWKYNTLTGVVTFTPVSSYIGTATIQYSIKGGLNNEMPYVDESYRSLPATISVVVDKPVNTHVISNRFIQPKLN